MNALIYLKRLNSATALRRKIGRLYDQSYHAWYFRSSAKKGMMSLVLLSVIFFGSSTMAGMVTFTFDDGLESAYSAALPVLKQYGYTATVGIITKNIDIDNYMNEGQLLDLYSKGWEIASHTISHKDLTTLGSCEARAEMYESKYIINEAVGGFVVSNLIAPYTKWSATLDGLAIDIYDSAALGGNKSNPIPAGYRLYRYIIYSNTTVTQIKNIIIQEAINKDRWVILMFHAIGDPGTFGYEPFAKWKLNELCQWLSDNAVPVVTIEKGMLAGVPPETTECRILELPYNGIVADSEELVLANNASTNVIDDDPSTIWHTEWLIKNPDAVLPHWIDLDLGANHIVCGITYLPRQTGVNGRIKAYEVYVSKDGINWGDPVAYGIWVNTAAEKTVKFSQGIEGSHVRLKALSEVNGGEFTSAAEVRVMISE